LLRILAVTDNTSGLKLIAGPLADRQGKGNQSLHPESDGYIVYDHASIGGKQDDVLMHCMAHSRRYFEKALATDKALAEHFLKEVQKLYAIERRCREENLTADLIMAIRKEEAVPVLESLHQWLKEHYNPNKPTGPIERAIGYALQRWEKPSIYTIDARLQIDNNLVENGMRTPVLGRKNYLFAGSNDGGKRLAVFYSILESAKKLRC
jgi:transposase